MEKEILPIISYLEEKKGYDFSGNRISMLERRITKRLISTGCQNFGQYLDFIQNNNLELKELINVLTINVTSFFRDTLAWEFVYSQVLPLIFEAKLLAKNHSINVWCAGCATGEEAYTVAILLNEIAEKKKTKFHINVLGTDINSNSLKAAKSGIYKKKDIANVKSKLVDKYFESDFDTYTVSPVLREIVQFGEFNLLSKTEPHPSTKLKSGFDIVICRNVLIYFNNEYQNKIFQKLCNSMNSKGFLMLGEAEIPAERYKSEFAKFNSCCKIYYRNGNHLND